MTKPNLAELKERAPKLFIKGKGSPYSISVGFWSWSRFLAVSLQVTWVTNPAVGCHYFPPGPQLPSQPLRLMWTACLQTTRQHCSCNLNPGPSVPESSMLTTRLPSHPVTYKRQNQCNNLRLAIWFLLLIKSLPLVLRRHIQPGSYKQ